MSTMRSVRVHAPLFFFFLILSLFERFLSEPSEPDSVGHFRNEAKKERERGFILKSLTSANKKNESQTVAVSQRTHRPHQSHREKVNTDNVVAAKRQGAIPTSHVKNDCPRQHCGGNRTNEPALKVLFSSSSFRLYVLPGLQIRIFSSM